MTQGRGKTAAFTAIGVGLACVVMLVFIGRNWMSEQWYLRVLNGSYGEDAKREAAYKLSDWGSLEALPHFVRIIKDPESKESLKKSCIRSIQRLGVNRNTKVRIASEMSTMPSPFEWPRRKSRGGSSTKVTSAPRTSQNFLLSPFTVIPAVQG